MERMERFLRSRCWDRGRPDINELLAYRGLTAYDPYEIVKNTWRLLE